MEIFGWRDPTSESPVLQLVDLTDNKPTLAQTVAALYGVHPEVVAYMTTMNAHRLYNRSFGCPRGGGTAHPGQVHRVAENLADCHHKTSAEVL